MTLTAYRKKRDFTKTPEPAGEPAPKGKPGPLAFVVHQHRARRLHYDFRLELDGVLKSWAVPKGPSLDPADKRLAVRVEDHPLAYGDFEGAIPEGEYGGGTVMLWDRGTWMPADLDPAAAYEKGALKFRLDGEKLHGTWLLVRMGGKAGDRRRENWLLIKERDAAAAPGGAAVTAQNPASVTTGRSLDEIAADRDRVWEDRDAGKRAEAVVLEQTQPPGRARPAAKTGRNRSAEIAGVRLTHPDRVLYAEEGITKRDLANYYWTIRDWALPHLAQRPLSLVRCPEGRGEACFFQKHVGGGAPKVLGRARIAEKSGTAPYLVVENAAGLVALAQMGVLEIHPWGATVKRLETPDRLTFDLDPAPGLPWSWITEAALALRAALQEIGLVSFAKTTGGKGLHVVVPLAPRLGWEAVRAFSRHVAETLAARPAGCAGGDAAVLARGRTGGALRGVHGAHAAAAARRSPARSPGRDRRTAPVGDRRDSEPAAIRTATCAAPAAAFELRRFALRVRRRQHVCCCAVEIAHSARAARARPGAQRRRCGDRRGSVRRLRPAARSAHAPGRSRGAFTDRGGQHNERNAGRR